jgi:type III pantothenate kinase
LRAMTDYLYEQTALLPQISLKEPRSPIGKNTVEAMRVGAVIGYRGLIREILYSIAKEMKRKLNGKLFSRDGIKVIATGGHSPLIASKVPEIHHVDPQLTLQGLRILFNKTLAEA